MKVPRLRPSFSLGDLFHAAIWREPKSERLFEQSFAEKFGFPYGLFFPYGRSAVSSLLGAMGWENAEVVLPAYTCVVVPHAIVLSGNKVRFVDCEPNHFNVSPKAISKILSPSTKMVIPTPLFGYPINSQGYAEAISQKSPEAFILCDAAQSYGATGFGKGYFYKADGAFFALGVGKILCSLYGGMLLLRDKNIFNAVKEFRDYHFTHPRINKFLNQLVYGLAVWAAFRDPFLNLASFLERQTNLLYRFTDYYYGKQGPCLPSDYQERATSLQAKLGMVQLARYDDIIKRRREIASFYEQVLSKAGIPIFPTTKGGTYSHFPLVIENRDQVIDELFKMGIQVGRLIEYACPDLPGYTNYRGVCPNASWFGAKMINIPIWDGLTHSQAKKTTDALQKLLERNPNLFPSLSESPKNQDN